MLVKGATGASYYQRLVESKPWVSNYTHAFYENVITCSCPKPSAGFANFCKRHVASGGQKSERANSVYINLRGLTWPWPKAARNSTRALGKFRIQQCWLAMVTHNVTISSNRKLQ